MHIPDYDNVAQLKQILDDNGFSMQKKFGQNFLINKNAREKIVNALDISENTKVWEVGPGLGSMTSILLERKAEVQAFEIDRGFIGLLKNFFAEEIESNQFNIVEGDVLKTWKNNINKEKLPSRFFGNLPYNIAATLIASTIENNFRFDKCVFTIQKEVALRMAAKPSSADYSSFSVLCQWAYDVKPVLDLPSSYFWPRPNVDSRAVLFTKKEIFPACKNPSLFIKMQRSLFSSRRKTVKNNLTAFLSNSEKASEALKQCNIDPLKRAEVLSIDELLKLSDILDN